MDTFVVFEYFPDFSSFIFFLFHSFFDQLILCAQCFLVISSPYSLVHIHPRSPHHVYCPPSCPSPPALFIHSFMYLFTTITESSWSCPYAHERDWCCRIPDFDVNTERPASSHLPFLTTAAYCIVCVPTPENKLFSKVSFFLFQL